MSDLKLMSDAKLRELKDSYFKQIDQIDLQLKENYRERKALHKPLVVLNENQRQLLDKAFEFVEGKHEILREQIIGETRKSQIVFVRQMLHYWFLNKSVFFKSCGLVFIGRIFNRDHSTIIHSDRSIDNYMYTSKERKRIILYFFSRLEQIESSINSEALNLTFENANF